MNAVCVVLGAVMLIWPALLNGYPLVFSDLGGLLSMGHEPEIGWDKPWVYGPLLRVTDLNISLWLPVLAQGALVSHLLWLLQKATIGTSAWRHVLLCAVLAAGTGAPWFTALLMPDIFAPITVISLFLLGLAAPRALSRAERNGLMAVATIAIAVHLAHLVIACGCLVVIGLLRWRRLLVTIAPLAAALAWLMMTNFVGNGVIGVSPYGSIFALARLQADGPGALYLKEVCPAAGLRLCAWAEQLPEDSDKFLWDPEGPVWAHEYGPTMMIGEAKRVFNAALRAYPAWAAQAAFYNTVAQSKLSAVGDTLVSDHLASTVLPRLQKFFPAAEVDRFSRGLQARGTLPEAAAPFLAPHAAFLLAGLIGTVALLPLGWLRGRPALSGLALMILAGLAANAFATGALSHPHDRYGARIAWLLLLPPLLMLAAPRKRV